MSDDDPNLERAYALETKGQAKELYRDWAETYEAGFADALGYQAPQRIAEIYLAECDPDANVLDIGAGTGLLGVHLHGLEIDAFDLSPEMLEQAKSKGVYRRTIVGDLTKVLDIADDSYGGFVSSGTFTHGHVGSECLPELIRIAKPGALFCCSVNAQVYDKAGFGSALAFLVARKQITPVRFVEFELYRGIEHDHIDDLGLAMIFRVLEAN
jgi:predicted TPR repeat methyltransferase